MLQTRIGSICACLTLAALIAVAESWQSCPSTCMYHVDSYNVNLSPLSGVWEAVYFEKTSFATIPVFFNLSVCGQLPSAAPTPTVCRGGHVCYTEDFQEFVNLGSHSSCEYQVDKKVLSLSYNYGQDALAHFGVGNVTISFVCGPTMGVPQVLEGVPNRHVVEILWITSAVCNPSGSTAPKNETKCYSIHPIHDNGLKAAYVDLSGLIKDSGFSATMSERPDIRVDVSVCRPMNRNDGCGGSMACLVSGDKDLSVKSKKLALSMLPGSRASATPHMEGDLLTVEYPISSDKVTGCAHPMVKIHFLCPTGDQILGPKIDFIDNKLCLINIIWNTMYACEISAIQSKTCKLSTPFGLEFDISGLAKQPMNVTATAGSSHYQYFLSPCSSVGLNSQCSGHSPQPPIRVTQTDLSSDACRSLGQGNGTLRYADNTLSLTYFSGDSCHNGISRTSIITLTCPGKVSSSCGSDNCVSFVTENECIYEFELVTELACATKRSKLSCEFKLGGLSYDLGRLTEGVNPTFAAISYSNDTECYLINPCGELEGTNEQLTAAKYCNLRVVPQACWNNSVCQIRKQTPLAVGFGSFRTFDQNSLEAYDKNVFSVSTKTGSNGHQALIRYICETGRLQSFPVFISQVVANVSEFHWPTYAACPQVSQIGSSCLVQEKSTGFSFNLTSLSGHTYTFNNSKYSYRIRVCDALPSGDCENGAAMCQVPSGHAPVSCGMPNSTLIYADSSLKLTYSGGHSCSGGDTRTTTMTFLCDPNAHKAVVENVTEIRHCEYLVEMRTKLACPPAYRATECILFTPSGTVYDLTELSRLTGNWQAEGADGSIYVINVCRPLNLQGIGGCNPLSAACRITSNPASPNTDIGYASSAKLSVTSNGDSLYLRYNYTSPSSDSQTSHCSQVFTNIKLTCNLAASTDSGPHFVSGGNEANPCEYNFQWETRAACPVKKQTTQNCSVTDTIKGYTFNLMPLRLNNHHYTVGYTDSSNNKTGSFNVTVCGSLRDRDSQCTAVDGESVCQLDTIGRNHSCGSFSTMSLSIIGETLHLTYSGGDVCHHNNRPRSVEIDFVCDSQTKDFYGAPRYQQEFGNNCSYSFVWPTALACTPRKLSCRAGGGKYDLSPLLESHHWIVLGEKDGYRYVIGGCNSLVLDSDPFCPHVPFMGGCKYKPEMNNTGVNLGFVTADLVVLDEGQLRLTYHNGEQCSSNGLRSTVHVNFHCQHGIGAGQPVLVPSTWDCLTQIDWATEYACSQDAPANQSTWIITNPVTHQTFDLTSISSFLSGNHNDGGAEYKYTIALGGNSIGCGTSQDKNIGACQTKISDPTKTKILGRLNNLTLIDGKVHVVYMDGDVCHSTPKPRRASISFEYGPKEKLVILPEQQCEYSFIVYTPLVRDNTPVIGQQCEVDNFDELDWFLSYKVPPVQINSSLTAYLSVCQPISSNNQLDTQGSSSCAASNSGACLVTSSGSKSLGKPIPDHQPSLAPSGNGVILTYTGGDACNATHSYSAKLLLLCSNNSETNLPELVYPIIDSSHPFVSQPCEFIFRMSSSHACPVATPSTKVSTTVCSISDPASGTTFDLSSLTNNSHVMMQSNGSMYVIGLCGAISHPPTGCTGQASICHRLGNNQWMPMVWANHSLTMTYQSPYSIEVVFPSGSECQGSRTWSASINVYCSVSSSSNRPILISDTDCQLEFSWPTRLLCINGIEGCFATDPKDPTAVFDLEPLSNTKWTGQVVEQDGQHLGTLDLRVCRNLNPTLPEGAHCSPGPAGICLNDPITHKYVNLGYMSRPPVLVNGSVVLIYTDGDQCGKNGSTVHTTIRLECHRELNGNQLNMQQISDCWYSGQWNTPLACKDKIEDSTSCVIQDSLTQRQYNFNPLARNISFSGSVSVSYSVCLCPGSQCNKLGARLVTTSSQGRVVLGKFHELRLMPNGDSQVLFDDGDTCNGPVKYSAMILMQCDRDSSSDGRLVYEKGLSYSCHKIFVWWTRVACLSQAVSCTVQDSSGKLFSFPQLYSATSHWSVVDSKNQNTFLLNICGPIHGANDTTCSGGASVCVKRKDGSYSDLALAGTQQITINSNGHPLIHFAGISSCVNQHHGSVSIEMLCGIKGLIYKGNDSCSYSFEWYTTFACGETTSLETLDHCENQYTERNGLYSFDLNTLRKPDSFKVKSNGATYYFNLCSDASECGDGVAACFKSSTNTLYPMASTAKTTLTFNSYWMQVTMASPAHVVVTVICINADEENQEQGTHPPTNQAVLESNSGDQWVYFRIYTVDGNGCTKRAATTQPPTTGPAGISTATDSKAVIAGIIIAVVVGVILLLVIITILWNKNSRAYLINKFSSVFAAKSNERVVYVRVPKPGDQLLNISDESSDEVDEEENEEEDTIMDTATLTAASPSGTAASAGKTKSTAATTTGKAKPATEHHSDEELLKL